MKVTSQTAEAAIAQQEAPDETDLLRPLVVGRAATGTVEASPPTIVGELIALADEGRTPLVLYPGQVGTAAVRARSVVDLHGAHVGKQVVLVFEGASRDRPIVLGVIRGDDSRPLDERPGHMEVDADGERLVVSAREQLVLRCGRASITLTKAGKVLIQGTYVSNRAVGVMRIKGGSVEIN